MGSDLGVISSLPGYVKNYDCFHSGLYNLICCKNISPKTPCEIFNVPAEIGNHAYLEIAGKVLNKGFTWMNNIYPDLELEEVKVKGTKCTLSLVKQSLQIEDDYHGYSRVLDRITKEQNFNAEKIAWKFLEI